MSNKTHANNGAKTASALRKLFLVATILGIVLAAVFTFSLRKAAPVLKLGGQSFTYETAVTQAQQERGLSYRQSLGKYQAMLFMFDRPGIECFWMKDMNFPLDMIWLNANKQVVYIERNAQPSSYPNSFCPDAATQYVIEVNAGTVTATGLRVGDQVSF